MRISKRYLDRAKKSLRKYHRLVTDARSRDINESDTAVIVTDFLCEVLGYDKYQDMTTEFAVRGSYCDLAIKVDGKVSYLLEIKSVGTELKENHVRQAVDYGAKEGCDWVLLTNSAEWQAYRIKYEQPIDYELALSISLLDKNLKLGAIAQHFYLISAEGSAAGDIDKYWRQKEATSRYVVAQLLLDDLVTGVLRRQLRRLSPDVKVTKADLAQLLANELIKRDALEGDKAEAARSVIRRLARKRKKAKAEAAAPPPDPPAQPAPTT